MKEVMSYALQWVDGICVKIEWVLQSALPWIEIVWLASTSIKESSQRVRAACKSVWISLPPKKILINMSPSSLRKSWTQYDLALFTLIVLLVSNKQSTLIDESCILWEIWLDWSIKHIPGVLPTLLAAERKWVRYFIVPRESFNELPTLQNVTIYCVTNVSELVDHIYKQAPLLPVTTPPDSTLQPSVPKPFEWVIWHTSTKRALHIAMQWRHNILLIWPPGVGKSLLVESIQWFQHSRTTQEMYETQSLYSIRWLPVPTVRPFRRVHHTISRTWLLGGTSNVSPGEISLAHLWVLYLDELAEFPRSTLELLRQPLQDKTILLSLSWTTVVYNCNVQLIATMNPCPCGWYQSSIKSCTCSYVAIKRYQSTLSWPLLDRFAMVVQVHEQDLEQIHISSTDYKLIDAIDSVDKKFDSNFTATLHKTSKKLHISHRWTQHLRSLAHSIAVLNWSECVTSSHLYEAAQYRTHTLFDVW